MRILNYGSLNIDHVYRVPHIVQPGETLTGGDYAVFGGGKGANQAMALGRAGADVFLAGKVAEDGRWLVDKLRNAGTDVEAVRIEDGTSGHAVIQVDTQGENAIFLFPGTNRRIRRTEIDSTLERFGKGDMLLLQNEINENPYIMKQAKERGLMVCLNPAPFSAEIGDWPLDLLDLLVANEIEGAALTGKEGPDAIMAGLQRLLPSCRLILTRGSEGAEFGFGAERFSIPAVHAEVVDTTGAGDTFVGYFLAGFAEGLDTRSCLRLACRAAAVCVSRPGAMDSIPARTDLRGGDGKD